jgi:NNP family nitrate/nitrite transporter-like MFS transporter
MGPVLILTGLVFLNHISRIIFAPFLLFMETDLGISHKAATQFFFLVSLGFSLGMIVSSYVSKNFTHRVTMTVGMTGGGACLLLISFLHSLPGIRIFLFLLGGCTGLHLPSSLSMITEINDTRNLGKALSIHETGPHISLITAPLYAQAFLRSEGWRHALFILGLVCILYSIFSFVLLRPFKGSGEGLTLTNLREILFSPQFWSMMILFCLALGVRNGVYSLLPTYLAAERGMELSKVNNLVSLSRISGIAVIFLIGVLVDRFGVKGVLSTVILLSGVMTAFLSLQNRTVMLFSLFLQPIFVACFYPVALKKTALLWPGTRYNVAISIMLPAAIMIGGGVFPSLMGILGERGMFATGFLAIGILFAGCTTCVFLPLNKPDERAKSP